MMSTRLAGARRRGAVLIVCVAILTVLALLAVSFARLMSLERVASTNYVDAVRARFLAHSGVERGIEELRKASSGRAFDDPRTDTWIYKDDSPLEETMEPSFKEGATPYGDAYSGVLGGGPGVQGPFRYRAGTYEDYGDYYKLQVIDAGAQVNLNSTQTSLPAILENLGKSLQYYAQTDPNFRANNPGAVNPIPSTAGETSPTIPSTGRGKGLEIVQARDKLPGKRFYSKEQLVPILGPAAYKALRDYVCVHSWGDPDTVAVNLGGIDAGDATKVALSFGREMRHPVNLNTAPRPVLEAALAGLSAKVPEISSTVATKPVTDEKPSPRPIQEDTEINAAATWLDIPPLAPSQARRIAERIVARRATQPFRTWEEFEEFIDSLQESAAFFPSFAGAPPFVRARADGSAFWYRRCKDAVKANANPNLRRNKFNPNDAAALTVDKGDFWKRDPSHPLAKGTPNGVVPTHTTEFSFSSMGFFEITSLGRITKGGGNLVAEAKLRVVVQVYSVLRMTTQDQFEKPITVGSTRIDPQFVLVSSYPEFIRAKLGFKGNASTWDGYLAQQPMDASLVGNPNLQTLYGTMRAHFDENTGQIKRDPFKSQLDGQTPDARWVPELLANTGGWQPLVPAGRQSIENFTWVEGTNAGRDGFFSSKFIADYDRYLFYPTLGMMGTNYVPSGNAPYYAGALEFWVKLQHDASEDYQCGMASATTVTRVINNVTTGGVQWYLFKNTLGQLRITRLYFEQAFDDTGARRGLDKPEEADRTGVIDPNDSDSGYRFKVARTDMVVDVNEWKAHEWHHVAAAWNDELADRSKLRVWIDGEEKSTLPETMPRNVDPRDNIPSFVTLNEKMPVNALFVGGFRRRQFVRDGIFKHVVDVENPTNATLDTFALYQNTLALTGMVQVPPSRFSALGTYKHAFATKVTRSTPVGSISWTVYRPRRNPFRNDTGAGRYTDATKPVVDMTAEIETPDGMKTVNMPFATSRGAGMPVDLLVKERGLVRFTLTFRGHTVASSPRLSSPVVDDVTVILLTDPEILSWEWVLAD
ncbi:MAG: hypothetical protein HY720_11045 [Planctomycetes bacterium]|nr:hypothetical protein [Planctomycetota bacterium]